MVRGNHAGIRERCPVQEPLQALLCVRLHRQYLIHRQREVCQSDRREVHAATHYAYRVIARAAWVGTPLHALVSTGQEGSPARLRGFRHARRSDWERRMTRAARRWGHRDDHPLQQLDAFVRGKNAGIGHGMVRIDREPALLVQDAHDHLGIGSIDAPEQRRPASTLPRGVRRLPAFQSSCRSNASNSATRASAARRASASRCSSWSARRRSWSARRRSSLLSLSVRTRSPLSGSRKRS